MKRFRGFRLDDRPVVEWKFANSRSRWEALDPCRFVRDCTACGFDWGARSSGAAQLAASLVYSIYGAFSVVEACAQRFMRLWVTRLDYDAWEASEFEIRAVVNMIMHDDADKNDKEEGYIA